MIFRLFSLFSLLILAGGSLFAVTLKHHYPLDGNPDDAKGLANLVVVGNSVTFSASGGTVGGFLRLGGTDDYLQASLDGGSPFSLLGDYSTFRPFSVSFWVRQTAAQASAGTQAIFGLTTGSTDTSVYNTGFEVISRESGGPGLRVRARQGGSGSNAGEIATGFSVSDGVWHQVVAVYETGSRSVYVDGHFRGSNFTAIAITTNPIRHFTVGSFLRAGSPLDDFTGDIDDFQVYEGALTAAQALQLYLNPGSVAPNDSPNADPAPEEIVDPLIGVSDAGSCVPGPCLPHASIYPSPNTVSAAPSGFKAGSNVVGFAQLHAQGAGPSTLSFGNFLLSPQLGAGINESDHASPISAVVAHPYSYRAHLDEWNVDCTVVAAAHSAIYKFDFPSSTDARLYFDVARKLGSATGLTKGSVTINSAAGTISGGGTFDGNWNPAAYNVYFYAKVDALPASVGTWLGGTVQNNVASATTTTRQRLGGWMTFDTTAARTVRVKIAVSFTSAAQAQAFLESEIPAWDVAGLEAQAKAKWNEALSVLKTPGISGAEARKLYTALYHSLVQPRDRTGDAAGWPNTAAFWDDHYTTWDTWPTLFPLLAIVQPATVASIVNSYGERFIRNGRAETAFIQGKDFQVGQGGDEVDLVIGDAYAKQIPGIDWNKAWNLLRFNADRRTPDYRNLGWVSSDGNTNGYDGRMRSGSSTLAFAYEDWSAAQVGLGLGHISDASALLARSANWRNVWDASLTGDGFSGFVRARARNGAFSSSSATSSNDFYQGTAWNYSFNVPHERDAMIELMGGRARFLQRLDFAYGKNSSTYIDYSNEPCFQSTWLFAYAGRPYLTSYWADRLRQRFGAYSFPGDEDSGAMSSLYFFLTAGFFPIAGQDLYYLHGARVPRLEFHQANGKTFVVTSADASDTNIYVQSATLNGQPLTAPVIRHADILAGGTLAFTMGPNPSAWGTGVDFTPPAQRELVLRVRGPWTAAQGAPEISGANTDAPIWGLGTDGADNTAIESSFPKVTLDRAGDRLSFSATVQFHGLAATQPAPTSRFAWGLFNANAKTDANGWLGYLAANDTTDAAGTQSLWKKAVGNATPFYATSGGFALSNFTLAPAALADGVYQLNLALTRTAGGAFDYVASLVRLSDGVLCSAFTGSDLTPATYSFDRIGFRSGDALDADSIVITNCLVVATRTSYAGRDLTVPPGGVFYLNAGTVDAVNFSNDGLVELTGGSFAFTGSATNSGTLRLKGTTNFSAGTLDNHGVLDTINHAGALSATVQNSGTLLDANSIAPNLKLENSVLSLTIPGFAGHSYQPQRDTSRTLTGPWENIGAEIPGTGAPILFNFPVGNEDSAQEFYRVRILP